MSQLSPRSVRTLARRERLSIEPARGIAVKRHVHEFVLDTDAKTFAAAFHGVLTEPNATFGRIEVRRHEAREGRPFEVGERFHGCFSVAASFPSVGRALSRLGWSAWVQRFEDAFASDYSEIVQLEEDASGFSAAYRYLEGSPIAGESRFTVVPCDEGCRLEVVFLYQEISAAAIYVLHKLGAALHDDVVLEQVRRAAERVDAQIIFTTMRDERRAATPSSAASTPKARADARPLAT